MKTATAAILLVVLFAATVYSNSPLPHCAEGAQDRDRPVPMPQPPRTPKIDFGACPFECCTFRAWKVTRSTALFDTWHKSRRQIASLKSGEQVVGLTGVHITFTPDKFRVARPIPELHLQPGDVVLEYMHLGEGFAQFWANRIYYPSEQLEGTDALTRIENGRKEWWVQVRTADGQTGWAKVRNNFDGMDACA